MKKNALLKVLSLSLATVFLFSGCQNTVESTEQETADTDIVTQAPSEETSFVFEEITVDFPTETITRDPEIGDVIEFGSYPQDADGTVRPIEWLILDIQDGQAFVLSKYCLDFQPFDQTESNRIWEDCTLRSWLNDDFYNIAFDDDEKSLIIESTISTASDSKGNGYYDTQDRIFVLSRPEANHYLGKAYLRCCYPTDYISDAYNAGFTNDYSDSIVPKAGIPLSGLSWWLRTPGEMGLISVVSYNGYISSSGQSDSTEYLNDEGERDHLEYNSSIAVRPALWLELEGFTVSQTVYSDEQLADDTSVVIDETNFPDENFRNLIAERYDEDSNGILVFQEIQAITDLDVYDSKIYSLDGIERFRYLRRLVVSSNHLSGTVDLSCLYLLETFIMEKNKETDPISLVFGNNPNLRFIICTYSNIVSIDVKSCANLETLDFEGNNLTEIDVTHCPHLKKLYCLSNYLTDIDLSCNPELYGFVYNGSWMFTSAEDKENKVSKLDLSHCKNLHYLYVANSDLEELNITGCKELIFLDVAGNKDILNNIIGNDFDNVSNLFCDNTGLKSIDLKKFPNVGTLYCSNNELTELNISNTKISYLDCSHNNISSLTLNSDIWNLYCQYNSLDYLDFSGLKHNVTRVECYKNGPITINVSGIETCYAGADKWNDSRIASYSLVVEDFVVYGIEEYIPGKYAVGFFVVDTNAKFTY